MPQKNQQNELMDVAASCEMIRGHLQQARNRILNELRNYPPPITACDQQFNFLLQQRDGITAELQRLRELQEQIESFADPRDAIEQFIRNSGHLDEAAKRGLAAQIDPANT